MARLLVWPTGGRHRRRASWSCLSPQWGRPGGGARRHARWVQTTGEARASRTFWWDRARPIDADLHPLRAVIFDADALPEVDDDGDLAPRTGLIDLVMSLFVAGIWVGVVSTRRRGWTVALVHQLVGQGLVETLVTADDVAEPDDSADQGVELYRLALWELGIPPESALAFVGTERGFRAATAAGLSTLIVTNGYADGHASATGCRQLHRRWWIQRQRSRAA
jgi:beta-phosphoglucomutase-like phosphatase (HAD superfamily)